MWKTRPVWPASAAQAADWPRLAEARGSLRHDLALKGASGEPAGRGLSRLVFHIGASAEETAAVLARLAPARHEHTYVREEHDEATDMWTRYCECGYSESYEQM